MVEINMKVWLCNDYDETVKVVDSKKKADTWRNEIIERTLKAEGENRFELSSRFYIRKMQVE